jgi:hypothetical protein
MRRRSPQGRIGTSYAAIALFVHGAVLETPSPAAGHCQDLQADPEQESQSGKRHTRAIKSIVSASWQERALFEPHAF